MITEKDILQVFPKAKNLNLYIPVLNEAFITYDMNTPKRQAMFLAQCLHESFGFKFTKEIWGPTNWQLKYEGNLKLGNDSQGDGKKYMGRGAIELTGKKNYILFSTWINDPSIIQSPEKLEQPNYYIISAIWFWISNHLNHYADTGDISGCTRAVNGKAMLGLKERTSYYTGLLPLITSHENS